MSISGTPKEKTDKALIDAFLNKGGKVTEGKTKPMKHELGLSNNVWNNPLTKDEKKSLKNNSSLFLCSFYVSLFRLNVSVTPHVTHPISIIYPLNI